MGLPRRLVAAFGLLVVVATVVSGVHVWCSTTILTEAARMAAVAAVAAGVVDEFSR